MFGRFTILLFTVLFMHGPTHAIVNGYPVRNSSVSEKIVLIDAREGDRSTVCTGSIVARNKILSASHCVHHLTKTNSFQCKSPCSSQVYLNGRLSDFKIHIHPLYKKNYDPSHYTTNSNYDIAIIEFPKNYFENKFIIDFKDKTPIKQTRRARFYGRGMSQLERSINTSPIHYNEQKRGALNYGKGLIRFDSNGIARTRGALLKTVPQEKKHNRFRNVTPASSQVLRSDSGGPLVMNGKIIGVTRNYSFHERNFKQNTDVLLKSYFTLVSDSETEKFIKKHLK